MHSGTSCPDHPSNCHHCHAARTHEGTCHVTKTSQGLLCLLPVMCLCRGAGRGWLRGGSWYGLAACAMGLPSSLGTGMGFRGSSSLRNGGWGAAPGSYGVCAQHKPVPLHDPDLGIG
ncbi:hypothetical protein HaLaN_25882 [Haematococcus lacustris]|uniref:Uncharacterized protein n=1 Tax=Haematococcus lacustris TaxID=44745 RepID=A0A6A0A4C0_HAELA|nr:hypothetical protein HaLaN_25882 [Haematococcus lacustris]